MVPILRDAIKVDVACCGNHGTNPLFRVDVDFDFGIDQLMYLAEQCKFPWLLGNVFDPSRGMEPLGGAIQTALITASNGLKIGLMGLAEKYFLRGMLIVENGWIRSTLYRRI